MKFYFSVPVWGENHTDLFINVCLPSLLAPGNIPGLRNVEDCRFFIHTRPEDEQKLASAPAVQMLSKCMPTDIELIREPIENPYITMSNCHREIMRRAAADDVPAVFPSPDHIWSDGSMMRMEQLAESGKTAIHITGVRLNRDSFVKVIEQWRAADGTLVVPARSLVKVALDHQHRIAHVHFWDRADAEVGNQLHPANIFWRVEDSGLIAHCFHLHPLMVRAEVRSIEFTGTIDDDLVSLACPDLSRQYVVSDSDEMLNFEISGPQHSIGSICEKGSIDGVCKWVIYNTNPLHRYLFQHGVKLHAEDLADEETKRKFDLVEHKASTTVRKICSINQMPTWQLAIVRPSVYKVRIEKVGIGYLQQRGIYQSVRPFLRAARKVEVTAGKGIAAAVRWVRRYFRRLSNGSSKGFSCDLNLVDQYAEAARTLQMWDDALSNYGMIRAARPDWENLDAKEAAVYVAWGDSLAAAQSCGAALERYEQALKLRPGDETILARCAKMKLGCGERPDALTNVGAAASVSAGELMKQRAR